MADGPGIVPAVAIAILLASICWGFVLLTTMALRGPRNHSLGIRLPSLMRTESAWKSGHAVALPTMRWGAWVVTLLAATTIATAAAATAYVTALGLTVAALLAQVLVASIRAHSAAKATTH